jgi:hypothetical protein
MLFLSPYVEINSAYQATGFSASGKSQEAAYKLFLLT